MEKMTVTEAKEVDWSRFKGSMPRQGIVQLEGAARDEIRARLDAAFAKVRVKRPA